MHGSPAFRRHVVSLGKALRKGRILDPIADLPRPAILIP
jgi:hypothetical protein